VPKHKTHRHFARSVLGKAYREVDRQIDLPYIWLGRKHRALFHTYYEAFCVGYITSGEWKGALAGVYHVWLDRKCSEDPRFKKFINWTAKEDARFKNEMRKFRNKMIRERKKLKRKR
jgi:hypothetical protein